MPKPAPHDNLHKALDWGCAVDRLHGALDLADAKDDGTVRVYLTGSPTRVVPLIVTRPVGPAPSVPVRLPVADVATVCKLRMAGDAVVLATGQNAVYVLSERLQIALGRSLAVSWYSWRNRCRPRDEDLR